jgi:hypothetical protein
VQSSPGVGRFVRIVIAIGVCLLVLFNGTGCTIIQKETSNRGGYLDYLLDQHWFQADSKRMRAVRAFAIQVSLARIASVSAKNDSDRQVLAVRIGMLTQTFFKTVYPCAIQQNPLGTVVASAAGDPCFYYDSAMVEYSTGLFDLAMIALPVDDAKNLVNAVTGTVSAPNPLAFGTLLNALLVIGRDALNYGRIVGALYRDTVELEVQLWLATPAIDPRPAPSHVTAADVAFLQTVYAQGNDDMPTWISAMADLHKQGLEPYPDQKFFAELNGLENYICDLITKDAKANPNCKTTFPSTVTAPAVAGSAPPVHLSTLPNQPLVPTRAPSNPPAPPAPKPAPISATFATGDHNRDILLEYLSVGSTRFDRGRATNLKQVLKTILADPTTDTALTKAQSQVPGQVPPDGSDAQLTEIVQNDGFGPIRQSMVKEACNEGLFRKVTGDQLLASACNNNPPQ